MLQFGLVTFPFIKRDWLVGGNVKYSAASHQGLHSFKLQIIELIPWFDHRHSKRRDYRLLPKHVMKTPYEVIVSGNILTYVIVFVIANVVVCYRIIFMHAIIGLYMF